MAIATTLASSLAQHTMRHFSAQARKPATKAQSAFTSAVIGTAMILPFVPPAIESKRERDHGHPNAYKKHHAPFCCHS